MNNPHRAIKDIKKPSLRQADTPNLSIIGPDANPNNVTSAPQPP